MPSEQQTGRGILFGITNDGAPITLSGFASFIIDTAKGVHKFKITDVQDELEFDAAAIATNPHIEVDLTWVPSGATRSAAADTAVFLEPLSKVTLTHFRVAAFNGDWQYRGDQSIDLSHTHGKMSLKIRKYVDDAQNASLTTVVVG